ncbi:MAG: ABC transporter substrate-binding protein [Candidatus Scalindua sp.]|nr:ABC transporter substrate-binding protein [Candidatus Scalindua sp.]
MIKSQNLSAYNEVVKGFQKECIQNNISITSIYDLNGKMKMGQKVARKIRKKKPDIVLSIGVLATTVVKEKIKDIPIVFCMVINHERFKLSGPNITGISTEIAIEDQFNGYQSILGQLKNIGVIYDPSKTGIIIKNAEIKMKHLGISLAKYEVTSSRKISEALENLIGKIDALVTTVLSGSNHRASIKSSTIENKVPLLCTSDVFVKAGALAAVSSDYNYVGSQAAGLAAKILELPALSSLGIVNPDYFKLSINTDTAEELGLEVKLVLEDPKINIYP